MAFYQRERSSGLCLIDRRPVVMYIQRRAVIDEPRLTVPDQKIWVAMRSVGIGEKRIEPHNPRSEIGGNQISRGRDIKVERAVEVPHAEVEAVTRAEKILNLRIGL